MSDARFWLVPFFHKKGLKDWKSMCTNVRGETITEKASFKGAFERRRFLIPVTEGYEWTWPEGKGKGKPKHVWAFKEAGQPFFCVAGIWDRADTADGVIESFAMVTTAAGADMANYHDRQVVILRRDQWTQWLDLKSDGQALIRNDHTRITVSPAEMHGAEGLEDAA